MRACEWGAAIQGAKLKRWPSVPPDDCPAARYALTCAPRRQRQCQRRRASGGVQLVRGQHAGGRRCCMPANARVGAHDIWCTPGDCALGDCHRHCICTYKPSVHARAQRDQPENRQPWRSVILAHSAAPMRNATAAMHEHRVSDRVRDPPSACMPTQYAGTRASDFSTSSIEHRVTSAHTAPTRFHAPLISPAKQCWSASI